MPNLIGWCGPAGLIVEFVECSSVSFSASCATVSSRFYCFNIVFEETFMMVLGTCSTLLGPDFLNF